MADIKKEREYSIVKSNDLIRKSRFDLTLPQQKIILRLIQMIQPNDDAFKVYEFAIQDYCDLCGITVCGKNYENIKHNIQVLRDKSFWLKKDGLQISCSWINKAIIDEVKGVIKIRLDDDLQPYLLQLKNNFTSYGLVNVLGMRSKYSPILYEWLKSYQSMEQITIPVDELKEKLNAVDYERFSNFKQRVLQVAINEINNLTDIVVSIELNKCRKVVESVTFTINAKDNFQNWEAVIHRNERLNKGNE